jgi:thiamine pyrophosphate-dependent acetolactate synthase large subunit-like protein
MQERRRQALDRRAAVQQILAERGEILTVSSLGGPSYDVAAVQSEYALDFPLGGAMGMATQVGLGLALAQPNRRVLVFAGDGEMLMSLGSLATIGAERPGNLGIVVIDNEHYAETGMQLTHTARGVDLTEVARACAFADARTVRTEAELADAIPVLREGRGPVFVTLKVTNDIPPVFARIRDGVWIKGRFRQALLGHI